MLILMGRRRERKIKNKTKTKTKNPLQGKVTDGHPGPC